MNPSDPPIDNASQAKSARPDASSVFGAFKNAFDELGRAVAPPESVENHFREARRHALLGLRELIDHRIQRMSREGSKGTRIVVE